MTVLGDAWVKIQPDLTGFSEKVKAGVGEAMKGAQAEAQAGADALAKAQDNLATAQEREARAASASADAQARLIAAQREAAAAAEAQRTAQDGDAAAASRNAEAQARLEAAQARVDATALSATGSQRAVQGAENDVAAASERTAAAHGRSSGALQSMAGVGGPLLLGLAGATAIVGAGSLKLASNFQSATTQLVTGAGESEAAIGAVRQGILSMAGPVAQTPIALAQGMFMIESAGYRGAQGLDVLRVAAEGARTGGADLQTTANALTTVMTDFHIPAEQSADAMNFLTSVVQQGKVHMQDLSGAISMILPVASTLSPHLDQIGGAMATLTAHGVDANRAATALRFTISNMANETPKGSKALDDIGLTAVQVATDLKEKGLAPTLQEIEDHLGRKFPAGSAQYNAALADISGGTRGLTAVLGIAGQNMDQFLGSTQRVAGQMDENHGKVLGWDKAQGDLNVRLDQAKATGEALGVSIGNFLIPKVTALMGGIQDTVGWFERHKTVAEALGITLGTLGTVFIGAYLVTAVQRMIGTVGEAIGVLQRFGATLLFGPEVETAGAEITTMGGQATVAGGELTRMGAQATIAGGEVTAAGREAAVAGAEIEGMGAAAVTAAGETEALGASAATAGGEAGVAGLTARTGGLIGLLSNPYVLAVGAAVGEGLLLYKVFQDTDASVQNLQSGMIGLDGNVDAVGNRFDSLGRRMEASTLAPYTQQVINLDDKLKPIGDRLGVTAGMVDLLGRQWGVDFTKMSTDDATNVIVGHLQEIVDRTTDLGQKQWAQGALDQFHRFQLASGDLATVNLRLNDLTTTFGLTSQQIADFATQSGINLTNLSRNDATQQIVLHLIDVSQHAQDPSVRQWAQNAINSFNDARAGALTNLPPISNALRGVGDAAVSDIPGIQSFFNAAANGWGNAQRQSVPFAQGFDRLFIDAGDTATQQGTRVGQQFPANLNQGLNAGKPPTQGNVGDYLNIFAGAPPPAGQHGSATGAAFADQARQALVDRYGAFSGEVAAYDQALQAGLGPIASSISAIGNIAAGIGGAVVGHAAGTFVTQPGLFVAGEGGYPETIISHDPAHRSANLGYWARTGRVLGVPGFAEGGFTNPDQVPRPPALTPEFGVVDRSWGVQGQGLMNAEYQAAVAAATKAMKALAAASGGVGPYAGGPIRDYMLAQVAARWPGAAEASAFDYLEMREAGYNPNAANPTSNARGLAQKISGWSSDYQPGNVAQQTAWMLNYIAGRYGDPIAAAAHERSIGWYDLGGELMPGLTAALNTTGVPETVIPGGAGDIAGRLQAILAAVEALVGAAVGRPGSPGAPGHAGAAGAVPPSVDLSRTLVVQGSADAATVDDLQAVLAADQGMIQQTLQTELANWGVRPIPIPGAA